jgi:oligopeptide transport system substrate-binding protein
MGNGAPLVSDLYLFIHWQFANLGTFYTKQKKKRDVFMKNAISRRQFLKASGLTAAGVCAAGLLSSCGGSSSSSASTGSAGTSGTDSSVETSSYTILYSSQPSTLNYLTTASDLEMQVGANCVDTLLEYTNQGVLREGLATSWEWDAATLTWTFHLRDENWVNCDGEVVAPVTAQDFVDALRYVLTPDYASSNAGLVTDYIAGADDYYTYLVNLANANSNYVADDGTAYTVDASGVVTVTSGDSVDLYPPVDFDAVGVKAVDDHTLTYTLTYDFPGFLSLLVYLPYEPAYGPLLEEMGDQFATSAETTYSCGAFYLAEYESLETWILKKNPENYDADSVYIDTVSRIYNAEADVNGPEMIKRGEIDEATITSDILDSWLADPATSDLVSMDRPNTNYTYFYMFNFMPFNHEFSNWTVGGMDEQYEPENWAKAVNNTNFRKAFLYGINNAVTLAVTAPEGYEGYKLNTITPPNFCANNAGVDYTKIGDLGEISGFYDIDKAKEYRDAAMAELQAQGVTFPVKVQLPYNPSTSDWDKQCQVLKQQLESVLNDGADFISIVITEGPSDGFLSSVRRDGKFAFLLCNWGADYSDPETESDPFYQAAGARGMRYAYLRTGVEDGFITGDTAEAIMAYMTAIEAAKDITDDIDARYEAFANAEALLINNALVVPMGMSVPAYIATRLNYWEGQYASTGFSNKRLKGIHVLDHYVSMSEYEANRDAR